MTERHPGTNADNVGNPTGDDRPVDDTESTSLADRLSDQPGADGTSDSLTAADHSGTESAASETAQANPHSSSTPVPDAAEPDAVTAGATAAVSVPRKKKKVPPAAPPVAPPVEPEPVVSSAADESLLWPEEALDAPTPTSFPPSKWAVISLGVLALVMFVLSGVSFAQNAATLQKGYSGAQVSALATILKEQKVATFTQAEIDSMSNAWTDQGVIVDPTAAQLESLVSSTVPAKNVTDDQIQAGLNKFKLDSGASPLKMPTVDEISGSLRTQGLILGAIGIVAALSAFFYSRGLKWARMLGMFVSGLVAVMWVMQLVSGSLSLPVLVIVLAAATAFWFTLKGRLTPVVARPRGMGGGMGGGLGGGLSNLFKPKPRP